MTPLFCPLGCLFFSLWPLMTPLSFVHWVVCPSLYDLWWPLSLWSIWLSVFLFMASDDPFLFGPLGCLSFSLWPLMTPFSFVHWIVCPSLSVLWWPLSLLSIGLSILLFMTFDDPFPFSPLGCLPFFSIWPLMNPLSFVHWVVCPLYGLWWPLSLLSIGLSLLLLFMASDDPFLFCLFGLSVLLLFMASDEPFLFCSLGCLSFSLWPLMSPFSFVHWVVCPSSLYGLWWYPFSFVHWVVYPSSLYGVWWALSLLSIGLSVPLLFMTSDDEPFLFCPSGCLSFFSSWPLITPFSSVHWDVYPSLYDLWWPLSLFSIGLSALLLFMASGDPFLFCPLACLSFFSLWPLLNPFSFVHWVVCPSSLCGHWWTLSLLSIGISALLLFMASDDPSLFVHLVVCPLYNLWRLLSLLSIGFSVLLFMTSDDPFLFCPLGCLSFFSLWPLMTPFSFVHWVVFPSLYDLWWPLSLLSNGLSALLLFMASVDPFLFCPLGCLSFFSLWPLMTHFTFVHWVVCSSLYYLWWPLSLLSNGLSALLLFMTSDDLFLFCPLGCLSFFSLWPLMTPFSLCHWVVCPSLYDLWWPLSLLSIGLSVLLFMASDDPFSVVHWIVCSSSLYGLWWPLSLLSIGLFVLLFMASDDSFLFGPLGCLSSLWPLMTPFSFVHWVVCPSSLYGLWWPISLLSIELSVLLFITSDVPFLFCPLGCLPFFSLWPLMTSFSFVHWVVCPSLYGLWWAHSLLSIGLSVLLLFMTSDDPFLFVSLGCLSFSLWPLMTPFSFVHWVVCPSLYGLWWPFLCCPLDCLFFFSLWPLMTTFFLVHWVVCPSLYGLWWLLSLWSIGLSVLFMTSDDPFLFCPLGCLS